MALIVVPLMLFAFCSGVVVSVLSLFLGWRMAPKRNKIMHCASWQSLLASFFGLRCYCPWRVHPLVPITWMNCRDSCFLLFLLERRLQRHALQSCFTADLSRRPGSLTRQDVLLCPRCSTVQHCCNGAESVIQSQQHLEPFPVMMV